MKHKPITAEIGIELSKISAAISVMSGLLEEMPDKQGRNAMLRLCTEIKLAHDRALEHLHSITDLVSLI